MTAPGVERRTRSTSANADTANRKDIAIAFLQQCAAGDVREAFAQYASPHFFHHNPFFTGDAAALMAGMEENAKQNPNKSLEIKHSLEDREFVVLHARVRHRPEELGVALVHIFRFKSGRIAEMWDIGQQVPATSPNEYGMF
jgi:predicted SnoaL-like aldol condensation-catalyzing enzyme